MQLETLETGVRQLNQILEQNLDLEQKNELLCHLRSLKIFGHSNGGRGEECAF